jgi:hypothetical protein
MFIQGNLQAVFDALYAVGAIDPMLRADWKVLNSEMLKNWESAKAAFTAVNGCSGNRELIESILKQLDQKQIQFVALEVAREYAEFTETHSLH